MSLLINECSDYKALSKGFNCLATNFILESNGESIIINPENISTEELTNLFIGTGTIYRLSIPFQLYCIANSRKKNYQNNEN